MRPKLAVPALLLLGAVVIFFAVRPAREVRRAPPSPTLPVASPIPPTTGAMRVSHSLWLSGEKTLVVSRASGWEGAAVVDAARGTRTALTAFNARAAASLPWNEFYICPSPDKKWLLWAGNDRRKELWIAATLDGARLRTWPRMESYPHLAWLPDSRRWAEITEKPPRRVRVYSVDSPAVKEYSASLPWAIRGFWMTGPDAGVLVDGDGGREAELTTFTLSRPFKSSVSISLPPMTLAENCTISSGGDRLLWQLYRVHLAPRPTPLQRIAGALHLPHPITRYTRGVWVSRLDGSGLKPVTADVEIPAETPAGAHWLPDGRHAAYWLNRTLWTVPIP